MSVCSRPSVRARSATLAFTAHQLQVALDAVDSHLYETIQFPLQLPVLREGAGAGAPEPGEPYGFHRYEGAGRGLINQSKPCMAFMSQFDNVMPIWGIQRESELEEWLAFMEDTPALDADMKAFIASGRRWSCPGTSAGAADTACPVLWVS